MANGFSHTSQFWNLSFSCFLVQVGIREYNQGTFWPRVARELSHPEDSPRWGALFLDTLQKYKLTSFPHVSGHRYVAPILLHGGIPENCLVNFFEKVLHPIINDQLDASLSDAEQIVAEWRATYHYQHTNKPVRRFLEDGGKPAADLLSRCLEMARTADSEQHIPSPAELGLPERVVQKFEQWWNGFRQPLLSEQRMRLNRPYIERDLYGEVRCILPEQKLANGNDDLFVMEILADGQNVCVTELTCYAAGGLALTDPAECSLPPAREYKVRLLRRTQPLREWFFTGLSEEGWIAFDERGRLLPGHRLPRVPFWLLFDQALDPDAAIPLLEELPPGIAADARWADLNHYLIDPTEADALILFKPDGEKITLPLADERMPLLDGKTLFHCHSGELPVYTDEMPSVRIPLSQNEWDIIVEDLTGQIRLWQALRDVERRHEQTWAVIPLSQTTLLSDPLPGEYRVTLRSCITLGRDQQFRFAFIRDFSFEFDQTFYLDSESPRLTLLIDPSLTIQSENSAVKITRDDELAVIRLNSGARTLTLNISAGSQRALPLTLNIPRLRWMVRGLANHLSSGWLSEPLRAQREDFEASDEITLVVQAPVDDSTDCVLELEGSQQRMKTKVRHGEVRFSLRPFHDSLRSLTTPVVRFTFTFTDSAGSERSVCPLLIRTRWIVDRFECRETRLVSFTWQDEEHTRRQAPEQRTVTFCLQDNGRFQQRRIRLWNLLQPWESPQKIDLPDGCDLMEISEPLSALSAGRYRIELFTEGEFETAAPVLPPRGNNSDIFNLTIGEGEMIRRLCIQAKSFRDHLSRRLAAVKSSFDPNNYTLTPDDQDDLTRTLIFLTVEGKNENIRKLWSEDLHRQTRQEHFRKGMRQSLARFAAGQDDQTRNEILRLCKLIGLAVNSLLPLRVNTEVRFENRTVIYQGIIKWEFETRNHSGNEQPEDLLWLSVNNRKIPLSRLDELIPLTPRTDRQ
jgi:hypothetical protein